MFNEKFVLNFTPTGMIPTRELTKFVPLSPEEIARDVENVMDLGINMVHLHARDPGTGGPTYKKEIYRDIIQRIRKFSKELILCVSTSGRFYNELEQRGDCLDIEGDCKPDFGSLTLSSLNFNREASMNSPQMVQDLARKMSQRGIKQELEAFDLGMINYAKYLIQKDVLRPPYYFNLIVGNIACAQADLLHLGLMIKELPEGSFWSVGGVGNCQLAINSIALAAGGGVRVGLEDNIWFDVARTKLATNVELVGRIARIAKDLGKRPYGRQELRELLKV